MGDEIRELREGILAIKHLLESQKGNLEKIPKVEESSGAKKKNTIIKEESFDGASHQQKYHTQVL